MVAYEHALKANPNSVTAMSYMSIILRTREDFVRAAEFLKAILKIDSVNGDAWGQLGT